MDRRKKLSKYVGKSDRKRSRYLSSSVDQIIREPIIDSPRSQQIISPTTELKGSLKTKQITTGENKITDLSNISFIKTDSANSLYSLAILASGESFKDIIISHWSSTSADAVISLYWSSNSVTDITATVSAGRINSISKGYVVRLLTITIPHSTTMSLKDNGIIDSFNNLNKDLHFYAISSQTYTHWTVIKE